MNGSWVSYTEEKMNLLDEIRQHGYVPRWNLIRSKWVNYCVPKVKLLLPHVSRLQLHSVTLNFSSVLCFHSSQFNIEKPDFQLIIVLNIWERYAWKEMILRSRFNILRPSIICRSKGSTVGPSRFSGVIWNWLGWKMFSRRLPSKAQKLPH